MKTSCWQILQTRPVTISLSAAAAMLVAACSGGDEMSASEPAGVHLRQSPQASEPVILSEAATALKEDISGQARRGSLSGLTRIAFQHPQFVSNTDGMPHREYWDLMRRIGVDPNARLLALLDESPGQRLVDGELWYVWPDLAARDPSELIPEKLSFHERRRLQELVGEDGIAAIRAGQGFPGPRTAIAANGRWVYYILGQESEED